jgi:hypothetical protein
MHQSTYEQLKSGYAAALAARDAWFLQKAVKQLLHVPKGPQ